MVLAEYTDREIAMEGYCPGSQQDNADEHGSTAPCSYMAEISKCAEPTASGREGAGAWMGLGPSEVHVPLPRPPHVHGHTCACTRMRGEV